MVHTYKIYISNNPSRLVKVRRLSGVCRESRVGYSRVRVPGGPRWFGEMVSNGVVVV